MDVSPLAKLRKTTKGKGRHFLSAKEGGGMTAKGRAAYKKENPGSTLSAPVTKKNVKPGSKDAARRKFDVYPSAYANMWASKQQGKGKC